MNNPTISQPKESRQAPTEREGFFVAFYNLLDWISDRFNGVDDYYTKVKKKYRILINHK